MTSLPVHLDATAPSLMFGASDYVALSAACDWLRNGHAVALVTVVHSDDAARYAMGALWAVNDRGEIAGPADTTDRIGAGVAAVMRERDFAERALDWCDIAVDALPVAGVSKPCSLRLLVEPQHAEQPLARLLERIVRGEHVARRVCLTTGEASLHPGRQVPATLVLTANDLIRHFGPPVPGT
ncbi:MAG: hypothetical protein KDJ24_00185 [Gammaproteobacteria bacterium]|nr:hypothetical protein [Gammaproteobacteria bacterium]